MGPPAHHGLPGYLHPEAPHSASGRQNITPGPWVGKQKPAEHSRRQLAPGLPRPRLVLFPQPAREQGAAAAGPAEEHFEAHGAAGGRARHLLQDRAGEDTGSTSLQMQDPLSTVAQAQIITGTTVCHLFAPVAWTGILPLQQQAGASPRDPRSISASHIALGVGGTYPLPQPG